MFELARATLDSIEDLLRLLLPLIEAASVGCFYGLLVLSLLEHQYDKALIYWTLGQLTLVDNRRRKKEREY